MKKLLFLVFLFSKCQILSVQKIVIDGLPISALNEFQLISSQDLKEPDFWQTIENHRKGGALNEILGQDLPKAALMRMTIDLITKQKKRDPVNSILLSGPAGCSKSMLVDSIGQETGITIFRVPVPSLFLTGGPKQQGLVVNLSGAANSIERFIRNVRRLFEAASERANRTAMPVFIHLDNLHLLLSSDNSGLKKFVGEMGFGPQTTLRDALIVHLELLKTEYKNVGVIACYTTGTSTHPLFAELAQKFVLNIDCLPLDQSQNAKLLKQELDELGIAYDFEFDFIKASQIFTGASPRLIKAILKITDFKLSAGKKLSTNEFLSVDVVDKIKLVSEVEDGTRAGITKLLASANEYNFSNTVLPKKIKESLSWLEKALTCERGQSSDGAGTKKSSHFLTMKKILPAAVAIFGESGVGKTHIVTALAGQTNSDLLIVNFKDLNGSPEQLSQTPEHVAQILKTMPRPSIVLVSGMDFILSHSPAGVIILERFVETLAGLDDQVLVFFELRNLVAETDLFRLGRIEKIIEVGLPSREEIKSLLVDLQRFMALEFDSSVDLVAFSRATIGFSREQIIKILCRANAQMQVDKRKSITLDDLSKAKQEQMNEIETLRKAASAQNTNSPGRDHIAHCKFQGKIITPDQIETRFSDVIGNDEAKRELEKIVDYLRDPEDYISRQTRAPRGVLLHGAPGTGKTLLAMAMAGEIGCPFIEANGAEFVEVFVGVGPSRMRDMFKKAEQFAPCIVFIDEIDAIAQKRGRTLSSNSEQETTLNQLLSCLDGFTKNTGIILIAATNRQDTLDPALMRPGRIDRSIKVDLPDAAERKEMIDYYIKKRKIGLAKSSIDLVSEIAGLTVGFSGADLENLVGQAVSAFRRREPKAKEILVSLEDMIEARDVVTMGDPKRKRMQDKDMLLKTARHESGHAMMQLLLDPSLPLNKLTIVPRGGSLGHMQPLPVEFFIDKYGLDAMVCNIMVCLGSRIAERIFYNAAFPGVTNDIEQATNFARQIVSRCGGSFLGAVCLAPEFGWSSATKALADREVMKLIWCCEKKVEEILVQNSNTQKCLDALASELMAKETLLAEDAEKILAKFGLAKNSITISLEKLIAQYEPEFNAKFGNLT